MTPQLPPSTKKKDLTTGSLAGNIFRLAGPMTVGMFLHSFYSMADAFWLGRLSKLALASQTVCWPFMFLAFAVGMGFGTAGTTLVSQYTGADRPEEAELAAGQTMLLLVALTASVALPVIALAPHLLWLVNAPENTVPDAILYLRIMMLGMPLVGFIVAYGAALRGLGDTLTVVMIGAVAVMLNIVMDPLLIFGLGPFPELGVAGAGVASVLARLVEAFVCLLVMRTGRAGLRVHVRDLRPEWSILRRLVKVGAPVAVNRGSDSVGFAVFQAIINSLGTTVIAAFRIGFSIIRLFNMPAFAVATAAAPIVGQALGARKRRLARRTVWTSTGFVAVAMFVPLVLVMSGGQYVARFFVDSQEVAMEARRFFHVVPASSYVYGVLTVLLSAFYGSGHTRPALAIGILRLWVLRIPLALTLVFLLHWGSFGAYFAMVGANIVCAAVTLRLFLRGGWESPVVEEAPGPAEIEAEPAES